MILQEESSHGMENNLPLTPSLLDIRSTPYDNEYLLNHSMTALCGIRGMSRKSILGWENFPRNGTSLKAKKKKTQKTMEAVFETDYVYQFVNMWAAFYSDLFQWV